MLVLKGFLTQMCQKNTMESPKNFVTSVRITATEKALLDDNFIKVSDVWYYGMLHISRVLQGKALPRCIYVRTQNRTTPRPECSIEQPEPGPRTCSELCGPGSKNPAALAIMIERARARAGLLNEVISKGYGAPAINRGL